MTDAIELPADAGRPRRPSRSSRCSARRRGRYAAVPMLDFDVQVSEPGGAQVYMIALSVQVMIEAARRSYDAGGERLVELFGPPERWATTTRACCGRRSTCSCRASPAPRRSTCRSRAATTLELAAAKYFHARARRRGAAGVQLQRHDLLPRRRRRGCRWRSCRGAARPSSGCRSRRLARADRPLLPEQRLGAAAAPRPLDALQPRRRGAARRPSTPAWPSCWRSADERRPRAPVDSLLYEGYALYPYTPGRPRTPRRRRSGSSTRPRTRASATAPSTSCGCELLEAPPAAELTAEVRFLAERAAPPGGRAACRPSGRVARGTARGGSGTALSFERARRAAGAAAEAVRGSPDDGRVRWRWWRRTAARRRRGPRPGGRARARRCSRRTRSCACPAAASSRRWRRRARA